MGYTQIEAQVTDQALTLVNVPVIASGGVEEIQVSFNCCDLWADATKKTAVFYRDKAHVYHKELTGSICRAPWEPFATEGTVFMGLFAEFSNGTTRTTAVLPLTVAQGAITAQTAPANAPDLYSALEARIAALEQGGGTSSGGGTEATGEDGGYYKPTVTQVEAGKATFSWQASKSDMPAVAAQTVTLPAGPQGPQGNDYVLTDDDRAQIAGMVNVDSVPSYVAVEADRVAKEVLSKQNPNTFTFLVISDMHQDLSDSQIMESNAHAGQGMDLVRQAVHIDFGAVLGDIGWGSGVANDPVRATLDLGIEEIRSANKCIDASLRGIQNFRVPGNHCSLIYNYAFNGNAYLDNTKVFPLYGAYNTGVVWPKGNKDRGYCYKDIDEHKLRVICMNTSDIKDVAPDSTGDIYMSGVQMQWFAETIDLSDKADAGEWSIIILSHCPLDFSIPIKCCDIMKAYLEGTSVSFVRDGLTISYDYSGKNAATIIGNVHGHNHNYLVGKLHRLTGEKDGNVWLTDTIDVLRIGIPNACFERTNEKGENGINDAYDIEFGETVSYEKVAGTAEDTAFCVVTVDTAAKKIYATHYGAGYDREIDYSSGGGSVAATYTITNALTNATNDNASTTVSEGGSYTATITPVDGYVLQSVTVTMGGVDITSSAYSDGEITVANVTGNIVITANAIVNEPVVTYTNLVPTAKASDGVTIYGEDYNGDGTPDGYKNDMRLGSNGAYSAGTGFVATGFIQQTLENPIYIKGNELSSDSYTRLYTFKTYVGGVSSFANCVGSRSGDTNSFDHWFTVETLGDKYYKLTPTQALFDRANEISVSGHYYYHLSIPGTGDTLITTDNEPIE